MKDISDLSDVIDDELCDAEKYIRRAMQLKDTNPSLAAAYAKASNEEMGHANLFHDQVVAIIENYRKANGEPSERMMGRYEYAHEKHMKKANEIKVLQSLYKG